LRKINKKIADIKYCDNDIKTNSGINIILPNSPEYYRKSPQQFYLNFYDLKCTDKQNFFN